MICVLSQGEKMETFHNYILAYCTRWTLDPLNAHEKHLYDDSYVLQNGDTTPETDAEATALP